MARARFASLPARLLLGLGLGLALAASPPPGPVAAQGYGASEAENEAWAERLAEAEQAIESARERREEAQASYTRARHDDYPRGEALAELEAELEAAKEALEEAETRLPELVEEARRAGVLPEVLRPYR